MASYKLERKKIYPYLNNTEREMFDRKSVRVFTEQEIGEKEKQEILFAAFEAPSAGCQQLYTILDITDQSLKESLADSCDHQPFIAQAPMVLVFCADCKKWLDCYQEADCNPRYPGKGDLMLAVTDTAIAAQNAVIAAQSLGIGSCYIGDIMENNERVRKLLHLPDFVFPAVMTVFGYPAESQLKREKPNRFDSNYMVYKNSYPSNTDCRNMLRDKCGTQPYEEWVDKFCSRKYNSAFSREMSRSVSKYLSQFS